MSDPKITIYRDVQDTEGEPVFLSAVMNAIQNGKWERRITELRSIQDEDAQKAYKNTLLGFTGSGVFTKRTTEGLVTHSGVLIIDIDMKDNPILLEKFDEILKNLIKDKYTFFLFTSCRGNGIAVGTKIDGAKHLEAFQFLEHYYRETYGLKVDKGCKDITRLRFVSYDPDLYRNESAEKVIVPPDFLKTAKNSHTPVSNDKNHEIIKTIIASGKILGDDGYENWLKIGFALVNEFGEVGRSYFHDLSKISPKYDPIDSDRKFDNCLRTNRGDVTFGTIVHLARTAGIDFKDALLQNPVTEVTVTPENKIQILDFPMDVFPVGLKKMVLDVSSSMGVPVSVTGSMVFTILSAVIGNSIRVSPKTSFEVSPFLWTCVVMPTGSGKSPLLELLTKPIKHKQAAAYKRYKNELKQYQLALRAFKKNESNELPDEPVLEQHLVQDSTVEALSTAFEVQPRGLLSIQDELASWLLGMNQYKSIGNDRQSYLQLFNSGPWSINRKSGIKFIPSTGLGIVGNIQPEMIPLIFENNSFADGLIQRLLFVYPDIQPMKFNRHSIGNLYVWNDIVDWCYRLPITTDESGFVISQLLRIEGTALDTYEAFYNEYGNLATLLPSRYRGFISKLFLYCLKFAGVLHVVESFQYGAFSNAISEKTITNAVELTKYYFGQISLILKLYEKGKAKPLNESQKKLIRILHNLQGEVENGMLRLEKIVNMYNEGLPVNFQLTSEKVASVLKNELGLTTKRAAGNYSYLVWEYEKAKNLFKTSLTTLTTLTEKKENLAVVNDDSGKENFEMEIPVETESERIFEVDEMEVIA